MPSKKAIIISVSCLVAILIISATVFLATKMIRYGSAEVPSGAMRETIEIGSTITFDKFAYKNFEPERFDIIVHKTRTMNQRSISNE